jgi:hypothetical protein
MSINLIDYYLPRSANAGAQGGLTGVFAASARVYPSSQEEERDGCDSVLDLLGAEGPSRARRHNVIVDSQGGSRSSQGLATARLSTLEHCRGKVTLACIRQYGNNQLAGISGAAC